MVKIVAFLTVAGLGFVPPTDTVPIRVGGDASTIPGIVVDGKDYAPVDAFAERLGAKVSMDHTSGGQRQILITPGAEPKLGFDDSPDTVVDPNNDDAWQMVAGSRGKIRIRDFTKGGDWKLSGELEVAPQSLLVDGHIPRSKIVLEFYVTGRDKDGKTVTKMLVDVPNVGSDGGRFPIIVNTYYGSTIAPATFTVRYNSASLMEAPPENGGG